MYTANIQKKRERPMFAGPLLTKQVLGVMKRPFWMTKHKNASTIRKLSPCFGITRRLSIPFGRRPLVPDELKKARGASLRPMPCPGYL